jgi:putative transposase
VKGAGSFRGDSLQLKGIDVASWSAETWRTQIRGWLKTKHVGQAFQPAISFPELRFFSGQDLQAVAFRKRRLPHWELNGSTYFVTFRVHKELGGALTDPSLAPLVEEALWFGQGERYGLHAYVVMPDHVHVLLEPLPGWTLSRILQGIKGFAAKQINASLGRSGAFWQDESFDHLVRNETDWLDKFAYIHDNPIKAGLVDTPQDYPFSSLVTMHSKGRLESLPHRDSQEPTP